jgi:hypothetical protein
VGKNFAVLDVFFIGYLQISLPLGIEVKGIARVFNSLKCLGGIMHIKPTAGCQISTLIFGFGWGAKLIFDTLLCA